MYNDQPWDPKIVAVIDRWSFVVQRQFTQQKLQMGPQNVVAVDKWSQFGGARLRF